MAFTSSAERHVERSAQIDPHAPEAQMSQLEDDLVPGALIAAQRLRPATAALGHGP
jgi:hypothetical protein